MNKKQIIQFFKFTMFSVSAGVVQVGAFTLLNELLTWRYWPAYLVSLLLSIIWNFTFKAAGNVPVAMAKLLGFYAVFTPVSTVLGHMAEGAGINEYIVLGVTLICNFVLEFLFSKFVM